MFDYEKEQFEKNVEILMEDRCTRKEAERFLNNSTVVYDLKDFTEHFDQFMENWQEDDPLFYVLQNIADNNTEMENRLVNADGSIN